MHISVQNIAKTLLGLTLLILGACTVGFISLFGLGLYAMTGNCDYCSIGELLSIWFIILLVTCSVFFIAGMAFILPGSCLLSEKWILLIQKKKKALAICTVASALILAIAWGWFVIIPKL